MHLAIDVREACAERPTGKGKWTKYFVSELLTRDCAITLFSDREFPLEWREQKHACRFIRIPHRGMLWHVRVAAKILRDRTIDAYVSPTSYIVPFIVGKRVRTLPVIHDLIAFRNEPHDARATRIERRTLPRIVKTAHHLFTVSAATKADLLRQFPSLDPAHVTPVFAGPTSNATHSLMDENIVLSVGTLSPRKNQLRLIQAFASLPSSVRDGWRLILVGGRGWRDDDVVELADRTQGVEWKKYLSDTELDGLYAHASIVAIPSLYEGFGMPILDAFLRGIPVLTSDRGSLKELASGSAFIIQPENSSSIAHGLTQLMTDAALRSDFRERGLKRAEKYSWKRTVDLFLAAM